MWHEVGVLHADLGEEVVDGGLAAQLGELVTRKARDMNEQEVANSLNALCKLEAVAAAVAVAPRLQQSLDNPEWGLRLSRGRHLPLPYSSFAGSP